METEQLNSTFINKNSIKILSEQELNKEEINKISNNHYDSVKLKYFRSLGVQAPIINKNQLQKKTNNNLYGSSVPTSGIMKPSRERSKTQIIEQPIFIENQEIQQTQHISYEQDLISSSPSKKKRSVSTPIPIFGNNRNSSVESSPDDFSYGDIDTEEENDNETFSKMKVHSKKFIPPHELVQKDSFDVGTARSLHILEQRRRNLLNV